MSGYCSNCKTQVEMDEVKKERLKNLQYVYKGKCKTCGTEIYKTIKE